MTRKSDSRKRYVVIGSGSSGALLCEFLSEFADVTLIEDGDCTISLSIRSKFPVDWPQCPYNNWESTIRYTATQKKLMGRLLECPQGKGVGGTSNINAMIWTLGHPAVFDYSWPLGWDSRVFESAIKRAMNIVPTTLNHSLGRMTNFISSCRKNACRDKFDYFSSIWDTNIHESYLATIYEEQRAYAGGNLKNMNNIVIKLNTKALSISFDDKFENAIGVNVCHEDGSCSIEYPENGGEIILCAGAFGTPKILLASGFVPSSPPSTPILKPSIATDTGYNSPQANRSKRIPQATERINQKYMPDLGKNLGDHVLLPLLAIGNWWESEDKNSQNITHSSKQSGIWKCNNLFTLTLFIAWRCLRTFFGLKNPPLPTPKYANTLSDSNNNSSKHNTSDKSSGAKMNEQKGRCCLNGIHGWITLDANGHILPEDSVIPPSIQILLVDGSTMKHMAEKLLPVFPKYSTSSSSSSSSQPPITQSYFIRIYNYCRPLLLIILKALFRTDVVRELFSFVFGFGVCNVQPSSRGSLYLEPDTDGVNKERLHIDPNYLDDPADSDVLQCGVQAVRKLIREATTNHGLVSIELLPGPWLSFAWYERCFAAPYYHFSGTCRMVPFDAPPLSGVVTPDLRVRGVRGLRIADSSVIPGMPTGPIAATAAAIGTIAADILSKE